mgnify:CR=1 FL=1
MLPGYARWLAGADAADALPSGDLVGVAPLPPLPPGLEAAAPERYDTKPSTLGDDYAEIRTLTMNFTVLAKRLAAANREPNETVRRHRLLSIQKMGAPGVAAKPRPSGPRLLGRPSVRDDFPAVVDNHMANPADTHGAVGPEHLVVALNTEIAIQTREGELLSKVGLGDFWAGFSHGFVFDPKVVYDHLVKRWVVFTIADVNTTKSAVLIALSQTSDPTGDWDMASIRVHPEAAPDNYLYADYPNVGYNKKWLAASVNLYKGTNEVAGTKEFVGSRIFAFHKLNYKNHLALLMSYNNQFLVDHGNVSEGGRVSAAQPEGWDDAWHVLEFMREGNIATVNVDSDALELGEFGGALKVDVSGTLLVGEAATLAFGGKVVLQFSENLDKWTDMQTYTNESGQLWININRGADAGRLFFRVRAE